MEESECSIERIEVIPGKLMYMSVPEGFNPEKEKQHGHDIFFCTDTTLVYTAFFADFGPLDLGLTYKFMQECEKNMKRLGYYPPQSGGADAGGGDSGTVVYYSSNHPHRRANSIALVMAFCIFVWGYDVQQAYGPFYNISPSVITFRDAAFCINCFPITILDVCMALYKVHINRHFVYRDFNLTAYQSLNKLQNGDLTWIVPGKFLAFSGPVAKRRQLSEGVYSLRPDEYIPILRQLGVSCIVRFNSKCYDRNVYVNAGIRHVDLYYEDGANPSDSILNSFLKLCEGEKGAIAVHCKAGLGRTGTNIAAYMIKHYHYTARETTAWSRICRPGCVVGPQQQYLMSVEARLMEEGQRWREKRGVRSPFPSYAHVAAAAPGIPNVSRSNSGGVPVDDAVVSPLLRLKASSVSNMNPHQGKPDQNSARPTTAAGLEAGAEPVRYRNGHAKERVASAKVATRNNFVGNGGDSGGGYSASAGGGGGTQVGTRMPPLASERAERGLETSEHVRPGTGNGHRERSAARDGDRSSKHGAVSQSRDGHVRDSNHNHNQGSYTDSNAGGARVQYSEPANRPNTSAGIMSRGSNLTARRNSGAGASASTSTSASTSANGYASYVSSRTNGHSGSGSNAAGGNKYSLHMGSGLGLVGRSTGTNGSAAASNSGHGIRRVGHGTTRKHT